MKKAHKMIEYQKIIEKSSSRCQRNVSADRVLTLSRVSMMVSQNIIILIKPQIVFIHNSSNQSESSEPSSSSSDEEEDEESPLLSSSLALPGDLLTAVPLLAESVELLPLLEVSSSLEEELLLSLWRNDEKYSLPHNRKRKYIQWFTIVGIILVEKYTYVLKIMK